MPLNQIDGFSRGLFYKTPLRVLNAKNARLRDAHGSWGSRRRESATQNRATDTTWLEMRMEPHAHAPMHVHAPMRSCGHMQTHAFTECVHGVSHACRSHEIACAYRVNAHIVTILTLESNA